MSTRKLNELREKAVAALAVVDRIDEECPEVGFYDDSLVSCKMVNEHDDAMRTINKFVAYLNKYIVVHGGIECVECLDAIDCPVVLME